MNKIFYLFLFLIFITGCSLNKNSKFWSETKDIIDENNLNTKEILVEEKALSKKFNSNLKINLKAKSSNNKLARNYYNNDARLNFDGNLEILSRYKFTQWPSVYLDQTKIIILLSRLTTYFHKPLQ